MEKKKLTIRDRKKIYDLYVKQKRTVRSIADTFGTTRSTVYNILGDRVKRRKTPRADKGTERVGYGMALTKEQREILAKNQPDGIRGMLEDQATKLLTEVASVKSAGSRAFILETVSRIQKQLHAQELESHMKRLDAELVRALVRRFWPEATEADCIKIFKEELLKLQSGAR